MENASRPPDEFSAALEPILAAMRRAEPLPESDWRGRKARVERAFERLGMNLPLLESVHVVPHALDSPQDATCVQVYEPSTRECAATLVYVHGGGRFSCSVATYDRVLRHYSALGIRVVAVDYRLPPEATLVATIEDVVRATLWTGACFRGTRLVLGGDSGGAGLAISAALALRDLAEHPLDGLLAVYPMLDDRTTEVPARLQGRLLWTAEDNRAAWAASTPDPLALHAVPARTADLSGLPPIYLEVGTADLFLTETIEFARRLAAADGECTLRIVRHAPHAYDLLLPDAASTATSWRLRRDFLIARG